MGSGLPKPLPPHAAISSSRPASRSRSEDIAADVAGNRVSRAARGDGAARAAGWWVALAVGLNGLPGFEAAWIEEIRVLTENLPPVVLVSPNAADVTTAEA